MLSLDPKTYKFNASKLIVCFSRKAFHLGSRHETKSVGNNINASSNKNLDNVSFSGGNDLDLSNNFDDNIDMDVGR